MQIVYTAVLLLLKIFSLKLLCQCVLFLVVQDRFPSGVNFSHFDHNLSYIVPILFASNRSVT